MIRSTPDLRRLGHSLEIFVDGLRLLAEAVAPRKCTNRLRSLDTFRTFAA